MPANPKATAYIFSPKLGQRKNVGEEWRLPHSIDFADS
jgi:hypothetical protein